jgi:hypothetical protein
MSTEPSLGGGPSLHNNYARDGMGPAELRVQFYEHARVEDSNSDGVAEFDTAELGNKPPSNFDPSGYLQYDLFATKFDLWDSDYNIYRVINMNARIDTFGINTAPNATETVADAFLSWVREAFQDTAGQNWQQFFANNIGMFLRNAAIHQVGMVPYYQEKGVIPSTGIPTGTKAGDDFNVRLTPELGSGNVIGLSGQLLSSGSIPIYGWSDVNQTVDTPYWLLISDNQNRLVWVAPAAINHNENDLSSQNKIANPELLSPIRPFEAGDLDALLGV